MCYIRTVYADLHAHTTYSDGVLSPTELVRLAARSGLKVLALTDHDTVEGVPEAQQAGRDLGVRVVPGIEISASFGKSIHVLGLFVDIGAPWLEAHRRTWKEYRSKRIDRICERLASVGVQLDPDAIRAASGEGSVGRPHVARALREAGFVESLDEAFARYLGDGQPGYVAANYTSVEEAIDGIRQSGGVAVLAHPGFYNLDDRLQTWVDAGLDGIECVHPAHRPAVQKRYRDLCSRLGVLPSGGTDYHGDAKRRGHLPGAFGLNEAEFAALEARVTKGQQ